MKRDPLDIMLLGTLAYVLVLVALMVRDWLA